MINAAFVILYSMIRDVTCSILSKGEEKYNRQEIVSGTQSQTKCWYTYVHLCCFYYKHRCTMNNNDY